MSFTIVQYYGEQNSRCGYCKEEPGSKAHGMHAAQMLPSDYQELIDRGWRRSGHYCYKPNMSSTCCPCYTIKCDALEFKISKSHKKVLKRLNRFLKEGKRDTMEAEGDNNEEKSGGEGHIEPQVSKDSIRKLNLSAIDEANSERMVAENAKIEDEKSNSKESTLAVPPLNHEVVSDNSFQSNESVKPPKKKAKQIRLERRNAKLEAKGINIETIQPKPIKNHEKTLQDYLNEPSSTDKHKLKLTKTVSGPDSGYGSFHQQYWLDDKLIAVGVIDILPHCVSSVYFFYDPEYSFLSLGTYGSLREIAFVQELAQTIPTLRFYYMGFYIHSCPKMRYKGKLSNSYLLCPETYTWHLLTEDILTRLDENKYQRLEGDLTKRDENEFKESDLYNVLIYTGTGTVVRYGRFIESSKAKNLQFWEALKGRLYKEVTGESDGRETVLEYGQLVGRRCAHRMIYVKVDE